MSRFKPGDVVWIVLGAEEYQGVIQSVGSAYATIKIYTEQGEVLVEASLQNLGKWNRN
jgi:hypothetical protein